MAETPKSMSALPVEALAVLVIDVQRELFFTDPPPFEANEVVSRINSVTNKARQAKVPVIFVQHQETRDTQGEVPGAREFHPDLEVAKGEKVVCKTTGDAFYSTNLEEILRSEGIQSLLLMGYATDFCMDATLRNAVSKDFEIFVVADAHTTNDTPHLKASLIRQHFNWVWSDSSSRRGIHLLAAAQVHWPRTK